MTMTAVVPARGDPFLLIAIRFSKMVRRFNAKPVLYQSLAPVFSRTDGSKKRQFLFSFFFLEIFKSNRVDMKFVSRKRDGTLIKKSNKRPDLLFRHSLELEMWYNFFVI